MIITFETNSCNCHTYIGYYLLTLLLYIIAHNKSKTKLTTRSGSIKFYGAYKGRTRKAQQKHKEQYRKKDKKRDKKRIKRGSRKTDKRHRKGMEKRIETT